MRSSHRPPSPAARPAASVLPVAAVLIAALALLAVACDTPRERTVEATGPQAGAAERTGPPSEPVDAAAERREVETWRAERLARLTSEDGWLTLVGLHWLPAGDSTLGSAADADVPLPASTPPRVGTLHRDGEHVRLTPAPGIALDADGKPFSGGELATDASEEPTVLRLGTVTFYPIQRGDKIGLRIKDSASPARTGFAGIDHFPIDPSWRVSARLEPYPEPRTVDVDDVTGNVQRIESPGELVFSHGGESFRLQALDEGGDELFLIFADRTTGEETYGAGRYLYAPKPGADERVEVDFNKAYNPPCAFTAYATCPLPPKGNRLDTRVEAGEKLSGHPA